MSKAYKAPKVLIFSDPHGHNYKEFSIIEDGVNSRLMDCVEVLMKIGESAKINEVDMIWFTGDLFHLKNNLDNKVIQLIMYEMKQLAEKYPLLLVPGHHDLYMWSSNPVLLEMLAKFSDQVVVVDKPMWIKDSRFFNIPIYAEPCTRKIKELTDRIENLETNIQEGPIFLAHQDMLGMRYGGFVVDQGLDAELLSHKFRWSFIGHYHNRKEFKDEEFNDNVISVGAPLQHNFGDVGESRGWWILHFSDHGFEHDRVEYIENDFSPQFVDVSVKEGDQDWMERRIDVGGDFLQKNFFRIKIEGAELPKGLERIKWKRISHTISGQARRRTTISFSDKKEDIIEKYVKARAGDLDQKRLIEMGRKYL